MMITVICNDCGDMFSLRGWIEKEDLINTLLKVFRIQSLMNN